VATVEEQQRLRLLTPVVKAFASEKCCSAIEEAMTTLGGQGYMEENGFGRAIRDALVEKIWEGTTSVLSLDLVRAADKSTLDTFISWAEGIISSCHSSLQDQVKESLAILSAALAELSTVYTPPIPILLPRPALFLFGYTVSSLYLLEHAIWSHTKGEAERETDVEVFRRWAVEGGLTAAMEDVKRARGLGDERVKANLGIVYGVSSNKARL